MRRIHLQDTRGRARAIFPLTRVCTAVYIRSSNRRNGNTEIEEYHPGVHQSLPTPPIPPERSDV